MNTTVSESYRCQTCAQSRKTDRGQDACAKFKIIINPAVDFCSWHTDKNAETCCICGATENLIIEELNNKPYIFCEGHLNALHTCQGCAETTHCAFKEDHSEPQVVAKTIRQGFATIQTQIKNPNLMAKHCATCICGRPTATPDEFICLRDEEVGCKDWRINEALIH